MLPKRQETSLVSLKCLLKIGAHPRGGFQSPCECLKPHTIVFCGRGWLQLALGTGFPSSDREVLGISTASSSSSFVCCVTVEKSQDRLCPYCGWSPSSLQCTGTVFLGFPEPPVLPLSEALPAHPESRSSGTIPGLWDLLMLSSDPGQAKPVTSRFCKNLQYCYFLW